MSLDNATDSAFIPPADFFSDGAKGTCRRWLSPSNPLLRFLARLGQRRGNDPEFERLDGGRAGLVFVPEDDVVFARGQALERKAITQVDRTQRIGALGLVIQEALLAAKHRLLAFAADLPVLGEVSRENIILLHRLVLERTVVDQQFLLGGQRRSAQSLVPLVAIDRAAGHGRSHPQPDRLGCRLRSVVLLPGRRLLCPKVGNDHDQGPHREQQRRDRQGRCTHDVASSRAKSRDVSVSCRVTNRRGRSQLMPKRMVKLRWTRGSTVRWPRAVKGSGANGSFQAQIFTDSPSPCPAASMIDSENVGCGCMMWWISSSVASSFLAITSSLIISVAMAPIRWAPRSSPYLASKTSLTKPSVSPAAKARPLNWNGNLPIRTS